MKTTTPPRAAWRERLYVIIFGHDTPAGAAFDIGLIIAILLSVAAVALETVEELPAAVRQGLRILELVFAGVFLIEYALRLACARDVRRYAFSFFGVIDLIAAVAPLSSIFLGGAQSVAMVRLLRALRVFRILRLTTLLAEAEELIQALRAAGRKIFVFLCTVTVLVVILGSAEYVVEGPEAGFTSIPVSIYWAIVTLTTVGYGDIAPQTPLGRIIASVAMLSGYAIIAVPTGIVSAELVGSRRRRSRLSTEASRAKCPTCGSPLRDVTVPPSTPETTLHTNAGS